MADIDFEARRAVTRPKPSWSGHPPQALAGAARVAAAVQRSGGSAPPAIAARQLLDLQTTAGNRAVAALLGATASPPAPAPVVQRYDMTYGPLHNGCGTDMHVYIDGKNDPDLGKGSKPSVVPPWFSAPGAAGAYLSSHVVQGHLLNMELGGPGDTMKNMTPISKSTNLTHFKQVEDAVKTAIAMDYGVEYRVRPDYNTHPSVADFGASAPAGLAGLLLKMAGTIGADYDIYNRHTKTKIGGLAGELLIKNEGAHLKGSFV